MRFAQGVEHLAVQLEDAPGVTQQHLAFSGQAHLAAVALEQLALQHVLFQPLHLHADGGLRAVDQLPCAGETALIGDGHKGAQHFGVDTWEGGHTSISEMYCIRNIRWIDLSSGVTLEPSQTEGNKMKGQKGYVEVEKHSIHVVSDLLHKISRWYELHRERELLAGMSDEALKDIGLSRADVEHETVRPFWDDPMHK
ncbi:hypothetical protein D3C84_815880 [compost metagenome]